MAWTLKSLKWLLLLFLVVISLWLTLTLTQLYHRSQQPIDGVLVLGGSIRREMEIAEWAAQSRVQSDVSENPNPQASQSSIPIIISKGSQPPCIRILFERAAAPLTRVWLEDCAKSTFDNYRYSLPLLERHHVHHVQVVTSPTHLPRAQWLAHIILGSHGIWAEMNLVEEQGIPGNVETPLKTGLDVTRSLLWAIVSQVYRPQCKQVIPLETVDLSVWRERGFKCEHQSQIKGY